MRRRCQRVGKPSRHACRRRLGPMALTAGRMPPLRSPMGVDRRREQDVNARVLRVVALMITVVGLRLPREAAPRGDRAAAAVGGRFVTRGHRVRTTVACRLCRRCRRPPRWGAAPATRHRYPLTRHHRSGDPHVHRWRPDPSGHRDRRVRRFGSGWPPHGLVSVDEWADSHHGCPMRSTRARHRAGREIPPGITDTSYMFQFSSFTLDRRVGVSSVRMTGMFSESAFTPVGGWASPRHSMSNMFSASSSTSHRHWACQRDAELLVPLLGVRHPLSWASRARHMSGRSRLRLQQRSVAGRLVTHDTTSQRRDQRSAWACPSGHGRHVPRVRFDSDR